MAEPLPTPDQTIDTSGRLCPFPIVETAKAVKGLPAGAVLCVVATDPGIAIDMPMWCKATRNQHLATIREGACWKSYVRKSVGGAPGEAYRALDGAGGSPGEASRAVLDDEESR